MPQHPFYTKPAYPEDWPTIAYTIKQERSWKCQICGIKQGKDPHNNITVHHHDHNTFNNDPDNLIILCQKCHLRIEGIYKRNRNASIETSIALSQGQRILPLFGELLFPQPNKARYLSPTQRGEPDI